MPAPTFRPRPVRLRVPATSANLGPGFDAFGLALSLGDDVSAQVRGDGLSIELTGEGADDVRRDESHLVVRAMRATFDRLGGQPPGLALRCTNRIPHGRGLGSSAAAIVAGVAAARALVDHGEDLLSDTGVLSLSSEIEGHPDNVAACWYGGFTIAWTTTDAAQCQRLEVDPRIAPVVFIPSTSLPTTTARGLLPDTVSHADASANAARAALMVAAMTQEPGLLLTATEDRLHQAYRASAMPSSYDLVHDLRADGIPAVISGAGPTVLALVTADRVDATLSRGPAGFTAHALEVDTHGCRGDIVRTGE